MVAATCVDMEGKLRGLRRLRSAPVPQPAAGRAGALVRQRQDPCAQQPLPQPLAAVVFIADHTGAALRVLRVNPERPLLQRFGGV